MKKAFILKFLFLIIISFQFAFASSKTYNVTLVSTSGNDNYFWNMARSFAQASANDLNIKLDIKIPNKTLDRFDYLETLKKVFEADDKPDFVIAKFYEKISVDILNLSQINKVPIFIINSNISKANKRTIGRLRRKFSYFMGHIAPNEKKIGYDLAKYLIKSKRETNPDGRLKVSAIATSKTQTKSKQRLEGLEKAVKEEYLTRLYKTVYSPSNKQEAYIQSSRLIRKYYDLNIVWAETDAMSLGANESIVDNNLQEQIITGGIGFTKESLQSVKNNKVNALIGGDFMDAGLALVLINDYLKGKDYFEQYSAKIDSKMFLINSKNIDKYLKIFNSQDWKKIDFKKFSKVYNENLNKYDFSINNLLIN